jgi:Arc/MetJ-type ribon-helix-helix transcriptional regulator
MFFRRKIKIDNQLYDRLTTCAKQGGYSSTDEFVRHVLERATESLQEATDQEQAEQQLKGLGYLE